MKLHALPIVCAASANILGLMYAHPHADWAAE